MQEKKSESSFAQIKTKVKVVFLGEQSTGKTSILTRFIQDKFEEGSGATVGIDFMAKNVNVGHNILRLQLWDTAGQERFRSLIPSYLKDASVAFIVFDITNRRSFDNLNEWIDLCLNSKKEKTIAVILGNKCDLEGEREVDAETIKAKVDDCSLPYFEVSAKTGYVSNEFFNQNINNSQLNLSCFSAEKTVPQPQASSAGKGVPNVATLMQKSNNADFILNQPLKEKNKKKCC